MRFKTVIELGGKTATGFEVPADVVANLGKGKKPAVKVTIGNHSYRSTVAVMDGRFMLPLSAENRHGAGVAAGDDVEVEVELDTEPRTVELPADFEKALTGDKVAQRAFQSLSYSMKRSYVLSIEGAKTPETRQRRIDKTMATLREG
jgi:Bacteriocin-protection, YdeI or OmpD-Associated/Domain of unknown function (DUF1905)